jgi:hypothetical protein
MIKQAFLSLVLHEQALVALSSGLGSATVCPLATAQ